MTQCHEFKEMCLSLSLRRPSNWNLQGRRAYVMTPPTRCKFPIGLLNGKRFVHTVGRGLAPAKTDRFLLFWLNGSRSKPEPNGGGEPPPYGTSIATAQICKPQLPPFLSKANQHTPLSS